MVIWTDLNDDDTIQTELYGKCHVPRKKGVMTKHSKYDVDVTCASLNWKFSFIYHKTLFKEMRGKLVQH